MTKILAFLLALLWIAPALAAPPVVVAPATPTLFVDRAEALGTLRANESVVISANVTQTVSAIHFDDGQRVEAGDLLVEMTSREELALRAEAEARVAEAEQQFERVRSLAKAGSASASLLDERRRELETARAALLGVESRLADRLVKAPFAGVIGLRNISLGALVQPGDTITTLDDDSIMKLDFSVPSLFLDSLALGQRIQARTRAFPDVVFEGTVSAIDSRVDPVTRSIKIRALIDNPDRVLRPGLLMRVELLRHPRESLAIPEESLLHRGDAHFVLVVAPDAAKTDPADTSAAETMDANITKAQTNATKPTAEGSGAVDRLPAGGTVSERQILIGTRKPGLVEVTQGLSLGELVVSHGQDKIKPGQSVEILAVDDGLIDLGAVFEARR